MAFTDDFAGTGTLGANWTAQGGTITRVSGNATGTVSQDNTARATGAGMGSSTNYEAEVVLQSTDGVGPCVSMLTGTNFSGYFVDCTDGGTHIRVYKAVANNWGSEIAVISALSLAAGVAVKLRRTNVAGPACELRVYINSVLQTFDGVGTVYTDSSSPLTTGDPGMQLFTTGAVQSFTATDLAAAAAGGAPPPAQNPMAHMLVR